MVFALIFCTLAAAAFAASQFLLRRKAEAAFKLAVQQAHFRESKIQTILGNAPIVFSAIDVNGIFQISEGKGLAKLGRKSNESVGRSIFEMHNGNPIILDVVRRALAGEPTTTSFVLNGVQYELYMGPEKSPDGTIIGATMLSVDITDLKKVEEEKAQMMIREQAALETTKLKSEFLATMSHEIRTPLNGVIGMTSLLLETSMTAEQQDYANTIKESGSVLLSVINDILDFSKIEAGRMDFENFDFNVPELISHAINGLRFAASAKLIELRNETSAAAPIWVRGDPSRIRQILNNLVSNAIKFTKDGHVTVRVLPGPQNRGLRIEVADTGIGLSPQALAKMFLPFSQAEASMSRRFGGTGLGLSISKQLAEKMGGEIGVESVEGKGSTFWLTLPLELGSAPVETHAAVPSNQIQNSSSSSQPYILVAEDNLVNQKITMRMLEKMGCRTRVVEDGVQALAALESADFDLVLMDCQMPVMDGLAATRKFRAQTFARNRDVPVLAMTANAMKGDKEKCLAAGMDGYVSKPISYGDLSTVISHWLEIQRKKRG